MVFSILRRLQQRDNVVEIVKRFSIERNEIVLNDVRKMSHMV